MKVQQLKNIFEMNNKRVSGDEKCRQIYRGMLGIAQMNLRGSFLPNSMLSEVVFGSFPSFTVRVFILQKLTTTNALM